MSTVFYRKWRPAKFSDVVGQQHITDTLRRAVMTDRVAHAYLFTGPRGVGKTSSARILAKALNSETDGSGDPIPETPTSIAIDNGSYVDLIEIDAASNRGIDDIRALRDRVLLRPALGDFKVYIIDEVHMLTDQAFNALLKTLEEPPPQVVMILATTDIHRVPATIISRCQRFDFRRLTNSDVVDRLKLICEAEEISAEPETLNLVASVAWGSLRDAENLLEQLAVSFGGAGSTVTVEQARQLLGIGDATAAAELATAILKHDPKAALTAVENEAAKGAELRGLRDGVVEILRHALLHKHGVQSGTTEIESMEAVVSATDAASPTDIVHAISCLAQQNRYADNSSPLALEVAVLQAVSPPVAAQAALGTTTAAPSRAAASSQRAPETSRAAATAPTAPTQPAGGAMDGKWEQLLKELDAMGGQQQARVLGAVQPQLQDNVLLLRPKYSSTADQLRNLFNDEQRRGLLKAAFSKVYGKNVTPKLGKPLTSQEREADSTNGTTAAAAPAVPASQESPPSGGGKSAEYPQSEESVSTNGTATLAEDPLPELDDPIVQIYRNVGANVIDVEPN